MQALPGALFTALNTILYCRRWAETVRFYERVLGLERGLSTDWLVEFRIAPGACLSIADAARASVPSAAGAGITITLRVEDARALRSSLAARGLEPPPVVPRPWGAEGFFIRDPEGHRVEVWAPLG